MKEEFKAFVKTKPELISYVTNGSMSWQKFYEIWNLYGEDEKIWSKYSKNVNKDENFSISSLIDSIKKLDMDSVQKGINGLSKAIGLLQGFTSKGSVNNSNGYQPRQIFKKFED